MRMTEQSSGSPARRRRTRRTPEAPEARVPEEPRVTNDDFGAGVDDAPGPWESRAEAFDAGPVEPERPLRDFSDREASDRDVSDRESGDLGEGANGEGANGEGEPGEPGTDADRQGGYGPGGYDSGMPRRRRRRRRRRPGGGYADQPQQQGPPPQRGQRGGHFQQHSQRGGRPRGRQMGPPPQSRGPHVPPRTNGQDVTVGVAEGVLELHPKGYGFLRDIKKDYAAQETDPFVSSSLIEKYSLRPGILIRGEVGPGSNSQGPRLRTIESVDGRSLDDYAKIKKFDELTAINPFEQIKLETTPQPVSMRVMDLLTPIGKGQRALIVAPPRTGKTILLQQIADAVSRNHPELHLIVLLIDERPEEVTEMRRNVRGEVIASSMDRDVESHVRTSQLIIERAKRIAESGGEVFVLLDSITRTARAFNKWVGNTGRTMSGGLDVKAMDIPKKMFGTARRFDEGGSLTVAATALIDTGSRMDEVIFQEFKGTGNMEMVLSRDLADRRIWPSIDITLSGTRREEKILPPEALESIVMLRRSLVSMSPVEAMEQLIKTLQRFPTNKEFLAKVKSVL
jgi:transcription termination factor Rho